MNNDELISDVLLWTPSYDRAKARQRDRTYIQQLCEDTGCTCQKRWTIGRSGDRGPVISVLVARHDDDDDDDDDIYIYIFILNELEFFHLKKSDWKKDFIPYLHFFFFWRSLMAPLPAHCLRRATSLIACTLNWHSSQTGASLSDEV